MKKQTSNVFRIIVGVVFLIVGGLGLFYDVLGILSALTNGTLGIGQFFGAAMNAVMFFAGFLALMKAKKTVCIVLTVILFIGFALNTVRGILANAAILNVALSAAKAVCSFLFIGCVDKTSSNRSFKKKKRK